MRKKGEGFYFGRSGLEVAKKSVVVHLSLAYTFVLGGGTAADW